MLDTMEKFLSAFRNGEFHSEDTLDFDCPEMDLKLSQRLAKLGILYTYGGMLKINPMAIRVSDRMHAEGKVLTEEAFHAEILESKDLYSLEHLDDPSELESHSF